MKRVLITGVLLLFLAGCTGMPQNSQNIPVESVADLEHTDHHAEERRIERNFYVEKVQRESTEYYLSYHEPDGCSTRVYNLHHGYLQPELFCQKNSFYYVNHIEGYNTVVSDGVLGRVTFSGDYSNLKVPDGYVLNYIIRTDEQYIYCAVNEGMSFLRADIELLGWEEVTEQVATGA